MIGQKCIRKDAACLVKLCVFPLLAYPLLFYPETSNAAEDKIFWGLFALHGQFRRVVAVFVEVRMAMASFGT